MKHTMLHALVNISPGTPFLILLVIQFILIMVPQETLFKSKWINMLHHIGDTASFMSTLIPKEKKLIQKTE